MAAWGPYIWEWGSILLRWLHVTAAIAWIGASFFFMHLDGSLRKMAKMNPGVYGVSWQVHGGGFYEMSKYTLAPPNLPDHLIWHKWQSYWTWISGFCLLCWVYYGQSTFFLIDPAVLPLTAWQAAVVGVIALALGWVVYDQICKSPLAKSDALLGAAGFGYVVLTSYVLHAAVFGPRRAHSHRRADGDDDDGECLLRHHAQPAQIGREIARGGAPDPKWINESKQRSTHNNYITLPVLFMMLSNHYPVLYANPRVIPLVVTCVIIAGALIRYFFNMFHDDEARTPWWAWFVAAAALWIAFWAATTGSPGMRPALGLSEAAPVKASLAVPPPRAPDDVVAIVESRCSMCHSAEPAWEGVNEAPKGVLLDSPENIERFAPAVQMQAVLTHAMPPNNLTEITPEERATLAHWRN